MADQPGLVGSWDKYTGQQRLAEVVGRMQGDRVSLESALVPAPLAS